MFFSSGPLNGKQRFLFLVGGSAVTLLLQFAGAMLGPAGTFVYPFIPFPAAYATMRTGPGVGGGIIALTAVALMASQPLAAIAYILQFGIGSLLLPVLLRRGWPWDRALAGALAATVAVIALTLGGYAVSRQMPVAHVVGSYIHSEVDQALAVYKQAKLPADQLKALQAMGEQMADFVVKAYPGLVVVASAGILLLTVLFLGALSAGRYAMAGPPFALWKLPEPLVWFLIAGGFGLFFTAGELQRISLNLLTVLLPVYFMQGVAIVTYFFRKKGFSPFFRTLGYLLIFVLNPLPLIVTGLGVFDMWVDFRKPRIKKT